MHSVQLEAEDGCLYAVHVERSDGLPRLVSVTITAPDGLDLARIDSVPLGLVAARAIALAEPVAAGRPSAEVVAQAYRDMLHARDTRRSGQLRVSIRRELAARFSVSEFTVDGWLKELRRDQPDLLPEPFTGRHLTPRKAKHDA